MTNLAPSAACLTPAGRGAIAVIRVLAAPADWHSGPQPLFHAANERPWFDQPLQKLLYGRWGRGTTEDVVACRLSAVDFEIQCHGGDAAVARILGDLAAVGIATMTAEQQQSAAEGVIIAELHSALSRALTLRTAEILLEQWASVWPAALAKWRQATSSERPGIDASEIAAACSWTTFARHLTEPWSVVLTGRPNVGKSSLINALLGYRRAIVAPQPGTTRDVVTAVTAFDNWPIELADTAGVRTVSDQLEALGIDRARQHTRAADLVVVVLDTSQPPTDDDRTILADEPAALIVAHKADLPNVWGASLPNAALPVSSLTGEGLETLQRAIINRLIPSQPPCDLPLPVTPTLYEYLAARM